MIQILQAVAVALNFVNLGIALLIVALGLAGLIQVSTTRDDAFTVIDRKKQNWMMLNGGAAVAGLFGIIETGFPLWIIGAVIVGVYWQDVRPAIKDVLDNASGAW